MKRRKGMGRDLKSRSQSGYDDKKNRFSYFKRDYRQILQTIMACVLICAIIVQVAHRKNLSRSETESLGWFSIPEAHWESNFPSLFWATFEVRNEENSFFTETFSN